MKTSMNICLVCAGLLILLMLSGCANFALDVVATYQTDTVIEAKKAAKAEAAAKEAKAADYTWGAAR